MWLIWFYLESDFTAGSAERNPFGRGHAGSAGDPPFKVPPFEHLTEAQADAENVDTQSEKEYGEMKRLERKRILEEDETVGPPMKKSKRGTRPWLIMIECLCIPSLESYHKQSIVAKF